MEASVICFTRGLMLEDVTKGCAALSETSQSGIKPAMTPVTEDMCSQLVGVVVGKKLEKGAALSAMNLSEVYKDKTVDPSGYRMVIVLAQDKEPVLQIMRSFKKVLPDPQNVIFAMVTREALSWTFEDYFDHLAKEHEYMKTHSPANDPDMKRM